MKFFKYIITATFFLFGFSGLASDSLRSVSKDTGRVIMQHARISVLKKKEPNAKHNSLTVSFDVSKKDDKVPSRVTVGFSGYVRFLADYRKMGDRYSTTESKTLNLNGWAQPPNNLATQNQNSTNPILYLETNIKPTSKSSISFGYAFNHNFSGVNDSIARGFNVWRLLTASAQIETRVAKFKISTAGGSGFPIVLSPMTSGFNSFRFNTFFRLPWDWFRSNNEKLEYIYNFQSVALDPRFASASAGIQGLVLECSKLPLGFGVNFLVGKNNQTGGFLESNDPPAQNLTKTLSAYAYTQTGGVRIYKNIKKHVVGINALSTGGYINNYTTTKRSSQYFLTANGTFFFSRMFMDFEAGISEFTTPAPFGQWGRPATFGQGYNSGVNQILSFKIGFQKGSVKFPSFFQVYSIGKDVVNMNSPIINTTGTNITGLIPSYPYEVSVFRSGMVEVDQTANNRTGFLFDVNRDLSPNLKIGLAGNYSRELSNEWNVITMQHLVNKYQRSQFGFFQTGQGPYGRITNQYIRSYETFKITDTDSSYKKKFYVWDFSIKRKTHLLGKPVVLGSYTSFNSVSDVLWPVPVFTNAAFLRQIYEEINFNYLVAPTLNLTAQIGYEKVLGSDRIVRTADNKIVNQHGYCLGAGFDWAFSKNAGFYLRQVWFSHEDKNFTKDKFNGWNMLAEIKVFF